MIINHRYKFIFLKTIKTAGTSLEIALSKFCGPEDVITRINEADEAIRRQLGFRGPQNYTFQGVYGEESDNSLAAENNPGKTKEFYNHAPAQFIRANISDRLWHNYFTFCFERNPFDKAISLYYFRKTQHPELPADISEHLQTTAVDLLSNWRRYTIDDQVAVDFVGRYERLSEDLETVRQQLRLPHPLSLPRAKSNFRQDKRHYSQVLPADSRDWIATTCAKEMNYFGYSWETVQTRVRLIS
ncbi:MAG: sulfotransferase family 2 domain-containing protein [Leptolyngbyaceae cyanobacterium]